MLHHEGSYACPPTLTGGRWWGNRDAAVLRIQSVPELFGRVLLRKESDSSLLLSGLTDAELALSVRTAGQFMSIDEVSGG